MSRLDLQDAFENLCPNVYFQPTPSIKLNYPCIIYEVRSGDTIYADDLPYRFMHSYTVTYVDSDPDATTPIEIAKMRFCKMDRRFTSDNLYHTIFIIYE